MRTTHLRELVPAACVASLLCIAAPPRRSRPSA